MLRGASISEIILNPEKEYVAGRKDGSDIRLQAEKGISREHFRLKMNDGRWTVHTVSRFGELFSLGKKTEEIVLEHGQSFQVPPYEFQLLDVPESDISSVESSQVAALSDTSHTIIGAAPQVPYIKIVNSQNQVIEMLRLEVGDLWVAGRDPSCQILISDQRVSRRQFEIHKVNGIFTVLDLASVNGTFLNGSSVPSTDPQGLKSGDAITVLDNTLYFELHDPNFKFKIEKIDIPPLPLEPDEEENNSILQNENFAEPQYLVEVPQVSDGEVPVQMSMGSGGPFTGIPPNQSQNQFYNFTPPPSPVVLTPWKKFTANKPLVILSVLIILGGAFWISDNLDSEQPAVATKVASDGDAFAKLTPKQQSEIKELYSLADQMIQQQKFDLALEKLRKIHDLVKEGYKDSRSLQIQAEQSLMTIAQQQEDDKRVKEEEERKKLFTEVAARCDKMLIPAVDMDKIADCLRPISSIDPSNADYIRITAAAEKIVNDLRIKQSEKKTSDEQIDQLRKMFAVAEKIQNEGYAFKAIKRYREVIDATLPDPGKLKIKAKNRVVFIQEKIEEKTSKSVALADTLFQEAKLKQAILALKDSLIYDPENIKIKEKIKKYTLELRRQMLIIYQESVIDESFGIVESSETRQGSKDKWKKIVDQDLEDGEYYKKAVIKLRKYGVM